MKKVVEIGQETFMQRLKKSFRKNYYMYLFLVLPVLYFIVFKYIPMFGNIIAFRKYVPGKSYIGVEWSGFKYFNMFLKDSSFWLAFKNTILLSSLSLLFTFPLPILFAILMNELTNEKLKKFVQSITVIPKFLSVVVVVTLLNNFLSPSTGVVNAFLENLGFNTIFFMNLPEWFRAIYISSDVWQFMGWSSIIYMAVLSSVDQEQYEAAMIDGANRIKQILYITMPALIPTISINLIINIGNILSVSFEKVLLMYQPSIQSTADVVQTLVYRVGLQGGNYSYGTAVGLFQGLIGLMLLYLANLVINKCWDSGLW